MRLRNFTILALATALCGCGGIGSGEEGFSSYGLVRADRVKVGDGEMSVVAPQPYNRHRRILFSDVSDVEDWTLNGPLLDGISFVKEVKKLPNYRFTPVVMLTTESQDDKKRQGQEAGAKAWVVKPFKPEALLGVVQKLVLP